MENTKMHRKVITSSSLKPPVESLVEPTVEPTVEPLPELIVQQNSNKVVILPPESTIDLPVENLTKVQDITNNQLSSLQVNSKFTSDMRLKWRDEEMLVIDDFLTEDEAIKFEKYIVTMKPRDWNAVSFWNGTRANFPNTNANRVKINKTNKNAAMGFMKGKFSYSFFKTMNNKKRPMYENFLKDKFRSNDFLGAINGITGERYSTVSDIFFSKYVKGSFLSSHCDKNNGRLAFVYNITRNWLPEFGGVLHIMNKERTSIDKSIVPTFNQLVIMNLPNGEGLPHYVSHVSVDRPRFAVTGWLN